VQYETLGTGLKLREEGSEGRGSAPSS